MGDAPSAPDSGSLTRPQAAVYQGTIGPGAFKPKGGIIQVGAIQVTLGRRA